jgi:hypothetical protein
MRRNQGTTEGARKKAPSSATAGRRFITRDRRLTLGKHGSGLTLEEARKLAGKRLLEVRNDRDPAAERRAFAAATDAKGAGTRGGMGGIAQS